MKKHRNLAIGLVTVLVTAIVVLAVGLRTETHAVPDDAGVVTAGPTESCTPHGIDAAQCWICDPQLRAPGRLWCREHERYEDRCWLCHPDLRDADRLYCEEHGLYEDECPVCRPLSSTAPQEVTTENVSLYCTEHDLEEIECGICHPELADQLSPGGGLKIRMPSTESAQLSGVQADRPLPLEHTASVEAIGEIGYDLDRLVRVTPLIEGVIRGVHVDLGDRVSAGRRLVTLAAPRVAEIRAELLAAVAEEEAARRGLEREQGLFDRGVTAEVDLDDARSRLGAGAARRAAIEQTLRDLAITDEEIRQTLRGERSGSTFDLVAPFEATVVDRDAVIGDVVSPGDEILRLADVRRMWVTVSVPEHEIAVVQPGQRVEVHSKSTGARGEGVVTWVSTHLAPSTRMASVRAVLANADGQWKAGMFVDAHIEVGAAGAALSVPADAVHQFGGRPFVFVDLGDGLYEVRRVDVDARRANAPGSSSIDRALVRAGLRGDELVVTARSFLVKSEFQKSRLGAGCVD